MQLDAKVQFSYKNCRRQLQQKRKRKSPDTVSYPSGAFSTKKQPGIINETSAEEKTTRTKSVYPPNLNFCLLLWMCHVCMKC